MTNTPMTTNQATKIYMDHARSLYRCLRQPHNPVPPAVLPQDQQRWRVAPAPDGRGTPDDHKPRPPHRAQGFWIAAGVLLASNLGSVLLAMPAGQPRVRVLFSPYFVNRLNAGQIRSISATGDTVQGTFTSQRRYPSGDAEATPTTLFSTEVATFWSNTRLTHELHSKEV